MPKRHLKKFLPSHDTIREHRWLRPFGHRLQHHNLWHLHRRSVAGGVAVGLFCGLIPGPFQMLGAAICAVVFRINLPLALLTTLYTNPFTIVPLYLVAFALGRFVLGFFGHVAGRFVAPPEYGDPGAEGLLEWVGALGDWLVQLGAPLAIGLPLLAALLAVCGYLAVRLAWRIHLVHAWRQRRLRRRIDRRQPPVAQ